MSGSAVFDARFYFGVPNWPTNPFRLRGKGACEVAEDFVILRGTSQRSLLPRRAEHKLRRADILNAYASGEDVWFDVAGVKENLTVGFSTADRDTAARIVALLPTRTTERFVREHEENEVFHDRLDYWSPSTPAIWGLLAANIGIFALMWLFRKKFETELVIPLRHPWALNPNLAAELQEALLKAWGSNSVNLTLGRGQYWRLVSSAFLHGSLWHLLFNMLALWQVGRLTERIFGSARFVGLYLFAGVSGSVASVLWSVARGVSVSSVGASGAIFGIIGGLLAFLSRSHTGVPPTVVSELRRSLLPFLLFSLWMGFVYPHTDNAAHIGGLVGGWLAGHLLARSIHLPEGRQG